MASLPGSPYGQPTHTVSSLWAEYQAWRDTDKAQQALRSGLIGSPDTIRKRLRQFQAANKTD